MNEAAAWNGARARSTTTTTTTTTDVRHTRVAHTVFELAKTLPNHGIGSTFTKYSWRANAEHYHDTYWTLTRVAPRPGGRSGKAWGVLTWKGRTRADEERVNGSVKPIWAVKEVARDAMGAPGPKLPRREDAPAEAAAGEG